MLRSPAASIDLKATEAITEVEGDEKRSYSYLKNLLDIAKMFRAKGLEIAVVVDEKKNFMGVVKRVDVERRIVDAVLNSSTTNDKI